MNILALEMASPENQHCAHCIGTLSFPIIGQANAMQGRLYAKWLTVGNTVECPSAFVEVIVKTSGALLYQPAVARVRRSERREVNVS